MSNNARSFPYDPDTAGLRGTTDGARRANFNAVAFLFAISITVVVGTVDWFNVTGGHPWRAILPQAFGPLLVLPFYGWIAKQYNIVKPPRSWPLLVLLVVGLYTGMAMLVNAVQPSQWWHVFMTGLGPFDLLLEAPSMIAYATVIYCLLNGRRPVLMLSSFIVSGIGTVMLASDAQWYFYH